jgi:PAS domain S-box-containing protein
METGQYSISSLITLAHGRLGFLVAHPLHPEGRFDGFILGVFDIKKLFDSILTQQGITGVDITPLGESGDRQKSLAGQSAENVWEVNGAIHIKNRIFGVRITLDQAFVGIDKSFAPEVVSLAGVLLAVLLSVAVYLSATFKQQTKRLEREILEKRMVEKELFILSYAVKQSLSSVVITDRDGTIEYVNPMFCQVTGYTPEEVIGKTPRILKSGQHPQWFYENLWQTILAGKEWKADICNKKKNGELFWELQSIYPILDERGDIINFISVRIDDTERKIAEGKMRHFAEELARSNKDLEDFAYIASHDLQEPLRKVIAFSDRILATEKDIGKESRDYLDRMQKASARMKRLIEDLLQFSRVKTKSQPFAPVDLARVIEEVKEVLELKIKKAGATVVVNPLPKVEADYLQMCQLFQNLIANSLKFHKTEVPPRILVEARENGWDLWEITVTDNGIGFDEKYAERVFKPFERLHAKDAYEGTGIGLAICKKIVDRHNGTITAKSHPGEGATFTITLPKTREQQ